MKRKRCDEDGRDEEEKLKTEEKERVEEDLTKLSAVAVDVEAVTAVRCYYPKMKIDPSQSYLGNFYRWKGKVLQAGRLCFGARRGFV